MGPQGAHQRARSAPVAARESAILEFARVSGVSVGARARKPSSGKGTHSAHGRTGIETSRMLRCLHTQIRIIRMRFVPVHRRHTTTPGANSAVGFDISLTRAAASRARQYARLRNNPTACAARDQAHAEIRRGTQSGASHRATSLQNTRPETGRRKGGDTALRARARCSVMWGGARVESLKQREITPINCNSTQ